MNTPLSALLAHPAIWRGGDCAPEPDALPTGFAALDEVLPGGGWPGNALTEIVLAREGIGELRLTLPTLAQLTHAGREVVWIVPPHKPHAPALAAAGIALCRLALVRCRTPQEALWAFDQALRAPECGAAFAWLPERDERVLRRLAVAAREGRTWGVLWRRPGVHAQAIAAPLRLALDVQDGQLAVKVLKRRGGELARPVRVDLAARWSTEAMAAFATRRGPTDDRTGIDVQANRRGRPTLDATCSRDQADEAEAIARAPRTPMPPPGVAARPLPDPRTSAGQAQACEGVLTRRVGAAN